MFKINFQDPSKQNISKVMSISYLWRITWCRDHNKFLLRSLVFEQRASQIGQFSILATLKFMHFTAMIVLSCKKIILKWEWAKEDSLLQKQKNGKWAAIFDMVYGFFGRTIFYVFVSDAGWAVGKFSWAWNHLQVALCIFFSVGKILYNYRTCSSGEI